MRQRQQCELEVADFGLTVGEVSGTQAMIEFALPQDTQVKIGVFDLAGRRLATVEDGRLAAGTYQRAWSMGDVSKGMYFVRLKAGSVTLTKTVVKVR